MGLRFRKSVSILPGVRLNLSKGGISTSIGGRGMTVNVSRRGIRRTIGLPGTGLSWSDDTPLAPRGGGGAGDMPARPGRGPAAGATGGSLAAIGTALVRGLGQALSRRR